MRGVRVPELTTAEHILPYHVAWPTHNDNHYLKDYSQSIETYLFRVVTTDSIQKADLFHFSQLH
jgi:hypothetical protein